MMSGTDILERLWATACDREPFTPEHAECQCRLASAAAKEIEMLRAALQAARDLITYNVESDPNDYAADAVTVCGYGAKMQSISSAQVSDRKAA